MKNRQILYPALSAFVDALHISEVSVERRTLLKPLVDYIQEKVSSQNPVELNFICTHNSRRSHLAQVWAQTLAAYFHVPGVMCYSGGTEATAIYPMVTETLANTGFVVHQLSETPNPVMSVGFGLHEHPIICFSKKYDHPYNPQTQFAAIMTCTDADEACPIVYGCEKRITTPYLDPKTFDNTPMASEKYEERSRQIATEMKFVFSQINLVV